MPPLAELDTELTSALVLLPIANELIPDAGEDEADDEDAAASARAFDRLEASCCCCCNDWSKFCGCCAWWLSLEVGADGV